MRSPSLYFPSLYFPVFPPQLQVRRFKLSTLQ